VGPLSRCATSTASPPNQASRRLDQGAGEHSILTVSFVIDGQEIALK
jgi:hypothetical protein